MSIQKDPQTAFNEFQAGSIDFAAIPSGKIKETVEKYGESEDGFTSTRASRSCWAPSSPPTS